jgi:hypothetical protein
MKEEISMQRLLRWRLEQAEASAPPAPRAAQLLAAVRPWWETWPELFRSAVESLGRIQLAYGHAMAKPDQSQSGHPIPVLVIHGNEKLETSACALYYNVRNGRLRLRFQLEAMASPAPKSFEVTFVDAQSRPLFSAPATRSMDSEYSVDAELPGGLAPDWEQLKVVDRMPFRLIIRLDGNDG